MENKIKKLDKKGLKEIKGGGNPPGKFLKSGKFTVCITCDGGNCTTCPDNPNNHGD